MIGRVLGIAGAAAGVLAMLNGMPASAQTQTQTQGDTQPQQQTNTAPSLAAQPHPWFEVHGSFFERYRDDRNTNNGSKSAKSAVTYGAIVGDFNITPKVTLYARLGGEGATPGGVGRDFNTDYYRGTSGFRGAFAIDQFGGIYHDNHGLTITLGRQDQPLDASATMYDQSWKVGLHTFVDGALAVKKTAWGSYQGFALSEDQYRRIDGVGKEVRNGLYGMRGTYNFGPAVRPVGLTVTPAPALTLGATAARFESSRYNRAAGILSTTNGELDATWQALPALQLRAEYGHSDAAARSELYYGLVKYSFTRRDSATAFTYHVGDNADIGHDSAYPNGYLGTRYFVEHDFDPHVSLILYYEDDRQLYGPGRSTSRQMTLSYAF